MEYEPEEICLMSIIDAYIIKLRKTNDQEEIKNCEKLLKYLESYKLIRNVTSVNMRITIRDVIRFARTREFLDNVDAIEAIYYLDKLALINYDIRNWKNEENEN